MRLTAVESTIVVQSQSTDTWTVRSALPFLPPEVAVMVVAPTESAVTSPSASTRATLGELLLHVTGSVGRTLPSASITWAVKRTVSPGARS